VLALPSLECRRLNYDLIPVYKILHGLNDINLPNSFKFSSLILEVIVSSLLSHTVHMITVNILFCNCITDSWNSLPSDVVLAKSAHSFKHKLSKADL